MTRDAHIASRCAKREYSVNTPIVLCFVSVMAVVEAQIKRGGRPCFCQHF